MLETVSQKPIFTKRLETYWDTMQSQFKRPLRLRSAQTFPYRNLVFKGGGVRGIAYIGVLKILEREGVLSQIERVAGTSVGAITAAIVSMRLNYNTSKLLLNSLEFSSIPQAVTKSSEKPDLLDQLN
jgi:predicted acylesterase/phospholipase RssA